ncbi:uncharacterized [Tachysurus ichikawai]
MTIWQERKMEGGQNERRTKRELEIERKREMSMTANRHMAVFAGGKPQQPQQHLLSSTAEWKNPMEEVCELFPQFHVILPSPKRCSHKAALISQLAWPGRRKDFA